MVSRPPHHSRSLKLYSCFGRQCFLSFLSLARKPQLCCLTVVNEAMTVVRGNTIRCLSPKAGVGMCPSTSLAVCCIYFRGKHQHRHALVFFRVVSSCLALPCLAFFAVDCPPVCGPRWRCPQPSGPRVNFEFEACKLTYGGFTLPLPPVGKVGESDRSESGYGSGSSAV